MSNTTNEELQRNSNQHNSAMQGEIHDVGNEQQVRPMPLSTLDNIQTAAVPVPVKVHQGRLPLNVMLDVPITLVFEVGRTDITIKELMELREGSFVALRQISVDSVDVRINDEVIAEGQTIGLQQQYGIRFGELAKISTAGNDNDN